MKSNLTIPDISPDTGMPRPPSIDELDVYHENGKGFLVGRKGDYIVMTGSEMRRHLLSIGFSREKKMPLSDVDQALHDIQMNKSIAYSGPLAGYSAGLREVCGQRILVTGAPKLIDPDPSIDWPIIRALIEQMLCADNGRQFPSFYGWLSHAYRTLRRREISQGQALALAGPRACGKTLLQQIIREILGGREGNPYPFMVRATQFNRELFGAENLMFGDEVASTSYHSRVQFGAMLKQFVVNPTQRCHGKGREAVTLDPFWRLTMSLNDEVANLEVLPPMSHDSIIDKITLLMAVRPRILEEADWISRTRSENWSRITAELPGFAAFLESYRIPSELIDGRFGVKYYHNPDLLLQLRTEAPEHRLLELIDMEKLYYATDPVTHVPSEDGPAERLPQELWVGTASELERLLESRDAIRSAARRLLYYQSACGQFLSSLARDFPERVRKESVRNGLQRYRLLSPPKNQDPF
jgi:hypothetical protein